VLINERPNTESDVSLNIVIDVSYPLLFTALNKV
jgi:hypothetical protein